MYSSCELDRLDRGISPFLRATYIIRDNAGRACFPLTPREGHTTVLLRTVPVYKSGGGGCLKPSQTALKQ